MANPWKTYADINDDIRHNFYERVFYGERLTGNLNANDMPGLKDAAPGEAQEPAQTGIHGAPAAENEPTGLWNPDAPLEEREAMAKAAEHAAHAPEILREMDELTDRRYSWAEVQPIESRGGIHGPATEGGGIHGKPEAQNFDANGFYGREPEANSPSIEPAQSPSAPANDMTPG